MAKLWLTNHGGKLHISYGRRQAQAQVEKLSSEEVTVRKLGGHAMKIPALPSTTIGDLKEKLHELEGIPVSEQKLVAEKVELGDGKTLSECGVLEGKEIFLLVRKNLLRGLGEFVMSEHSGIQIDNETCLRKNTRLPDSNNVLVSHYIKEPCFVEFEISCTRDEMVIGVTNDGAQVEKVSGSPNMNLTCIWAYGKEGGHMPVAKLGNVALREGNSGMPIQGFQEGDSVAVHVNPEKGQVIWYKNGELALDNTQLQGDPLVGGSSPLQIYVMVDAPTDEVNIRRFGPGKPVKPPELKKAEVWDIGRLKPDSAGFTVMGKVLGEPKEIESKGLCEVSVGDATGKVTCSLKTDQAEMMKTSLPDSKVMLFRNARIVMVKGFMRLVVDKWGKLEPSPDNTMDTIGDKDISATEFELVS